MDPHASDYVDVSPYVYALNNPLIFVDPDGKDVINADEERLKKAQEAQKQAQANYDKASGGRTSKSDFANKSEFKEFKNARTELNKSNRELSNATTAYNQTEAAINQLARNDPGTFVQLNNLTDSKGKMVDVLVTSSEGMQANQHSAQTAWGYNPSTGALFSPAPGSGGVMYNTLTVRLQSGVSQPDVKLAHELGHGADIVRRPLDYWNNRSAVSTNDCRDPNLRNDPFVKPAMDAEDHYINIRSGKR